MNACAAFYETRSFRDITMNEIGAATSFTRTSIYNYFQTREGIFLALLQREYEWWAADMERPTEPHEALSSGELVGERAHALERRGLLLKLMSIDLHDMEQGSRMEYLVRFKRTYGLPLQAVGRLLEKFRLQMSEHARQKFLYASFPFLHGGIGQASAGYGGGRRRFCVPIHLSARDRVTTQEIWDHPLLLPGWPVARSEVLNLLGRDEV